ncbi:MAG: guanylate kinase [Microbacteriaceae bacterium]|nr:guanylate kinase [Microbacteriaceae bacterium]MDR9443476.1 guanylate kinase [Microbacteriaceae bacterium]
MVIVGPAGVGKGSIVSGLLSRREDFVLSVSATTRKPRPSETDGVEYYFVDDQQFDRLVAREEMLEWAWVFGLNRYGTPKEAVKNLQDKGKSVILEIDLDGARQVRKTAPEAVQIFIAPPSFDELESRLRGRGTETEDQLKARLETAREELAAQNEFDRVFINDDLDKTTQEVLNYLLQRKEEND